MDFTALATRVFAGLDGVRACLVLSADGLTLGVHPPTGEERAREAWDRLQDLGDPQRGFIDMGDEVWALLRRGPYSGVLVTGPGAKPGLLLDRLEFLLRTAEEARVRDSTDLATEPARAEGSRRRRTSLHAEAKAEPKRVRAGARKTPPPAEPPGAQAAPRYSAPDVLRGAAKRVVDITRAASEEQGHAAEGPTVEPPPAPAESAPQPAPRAGTDDDPEVDRVALAREFGKLLTERDGSG